MQIDFLPNSLIFTTDACLRLNVCVYFCASVRQTDLISVKILFLKDLLATHIDCFGLLFVKSNQHSNLNKSKGIMLKNEFIKAKIVCTNIFYVLLRKVIFWQ